MLADFSDESFFFFFLKDLDDESLDLVFLTLVFLMPSVIGTDEMSRLSVTDVGESLVLGDPPNFLRLAMGICRGFFLCGIGVEIAWSSFDVSLTLRMKLFPMPDN